MVDTCVTSFFTTVRSLIRSRALRWRRPQPKRAHHRGQCLGVCALFPLTGCAAAPSINVLGSFFPAWLICIVVGVLLTVASLQIFVAIKIAPHLGPASLIYPCLGALWVFATWLILFGS
jgi:hypothetical protein